MKKNTEIEEDLGLLLLMQQVDKQAQISEEEFLKALREWKKESDNCSS